MVGTGEWRLESQNIKCMAAYDRYNFELTFCQLKIIFRSLDRYWVDYHDYHGTSIYFACGYFSWLQLLTNL